MGSVGRSSDSSKNPVLVLSNRVDCGSSDQIAVPTLSEREGLFRFMVQDTVGPVVSLSSLTSEERKRSVGGGVLAGGWA